ncbi:hypothetical protein TSTA_107240 [Talaromyces stipitatus ATCC 10500]|uniref:Carboxymuconolactone decarboxylase-like domain-containing protein n=1 Tax=Talaromyces stipitatus (strain ATCC 10500 / CBS 375.48 / QM 6759 / NRRL 1006) TaxID=441959 RepID=B8MN68_TALSN|nr:uncharacterized protein TSTA_107240 [Talaromyces stipitatus ATCC 10500]EED14517.1 hypothetical protein TSTA_107240 [Talaromyces stipitatus ATCC 10500]
MSRFPQIPVHQLTRAQKLIEINTQDVFSRAPPQLEWKDASGNILGPYAALFYTDDFVEPWFKLAFAITRQSRFTLKQRELAILAVLAEYDVPYVLYAHSEIALASGLSKEQIQQPVHGSVPGDLNEEDAMVYSLALTMTRLRRPMKMDLFEKATKVLRRDQIAGLAHIVSGFVYVAILTNIGDGIVPMTKDGMFTATKNFAFEE